MGNSFAAAFYSYKTLMRKTIVIYLSIPIDNNNELNDNKKTATRLKYNNNKRYRDNNSY